MLATATADASIGAVLGETRTPPAVSVLVATRNRVASLERLLASLRRDGAGLAQGSEIVVADNGSSDGTAGLLSGWVSGASGRCVVRVDEPGKSRALNRALAAARAPLLAFVDDDEEVGSGWLDGLVRFCAQHPEYAAGTGSVLPPADFTDPELRERLEWYRTIAFFDGGDTVHDKQTLYGGNMVIRRTAFEAIGGFDERLGPGALGGWEDIDLAERLRRAGLRIGYMPGVVVHHCIDPARLTLEYFRKHSRVAARSAYAMNPQAWSKSLPRLVDSSLAFLFWSLLRRPLRREHARGRLIRHAEIVRLRFSHD